MSLEAAIQSLVGKRVLVASDFDGTLAELVDHHDDVVANRKALALLARLERNPDVAVAVVSGRSREDLLSILGQPEGWIVVGEHGGDTGDSQSVDSDAVAAVAQQLHEIASENPGTRVETKRMSVVFHYRTAEGDVDDALDQVRAVAEPQMVVSEGKKVVEIHISTITKGGAVASLRIELEADAVIFVGDDVTDETVFSTLGPADIGVKVGEGQTVARHRVGGVADVVTFLEDVSRVLG